MKALILGAGGMAGHMICLYLKEKGIVVKAFARKNLSFCDTIIGDALNKNDVKQAVDSDDFDVVINCIGVLNRNVDQNLYEGVYINSSLPHLLTKLTADKKSKVIQLSTDCVFSGQENGSYQEDSFRSADDPYGRSKALGEFNDNKNLTFRTSIIGPDMNKDGIGLFNWFMSQQSEVNGYADVIWTGVSTITLARAIYCAVEHKLTGLYHLVNNASINKFELLMLLNNLRASPVNITEFHGVSSDKSLINTRHNFDFEVPSYEKMVKEIDGWVSSHANFYPHYRLKGSI